MSSVSHPVQAQGSQPNVTTSPQTFFNSFGDNANNNSTFNHAPPSVPTFYESPHAGAGNHQFERKPENAPLQYQQQTTTGSGFQTTQAPFMPSPSTSPMQLPPPPQTEAFTDDLYTSNQQKNLPAPPPNFAFKQQQRNTFDYHQPTVNVDPYNIQSQPPSWQSNGMNQNYPQQLHQTPTSTLESFNNPQQIVTGPEQHRQGSSGFGSSSRFFENIETTTNDVSQDIGQQHQLSTVVQPSEHEQFYPENRERLDDVSTPPGRSSSFTDRHNYLVTGQLSQERISLPQQQFVQTQREPVEELPPPGLSRMVVGQPENMQDHSSVPPRSNRLVTGTETTPSSYINYQRQADGEVSHSPTPTPFLNSLHNHSNTTEVTSSSDRNLYLVAGESDANFQRVIPGVESHINLPTSVVASMQSLHIQDDSNQNASTTAQERNLNVDGMETLSIDNEPREEDIDGANDNNHLSVPSIEHISNEQDSDVREEAIEGANAEADKSREKQKSDVGLSSEDSELRALEASKTKARRSKKYDESNESEVSEGDKREKYRKQSREKSSRDDHRRRDGDRRPRKADNVDGSKYADSKRRTDDEEEYRRTRKKGSRRPQEGEEVDEKERKKREKYRGDPRRSKIKFFFKSFLHLTMFINFLRRLRL